MDVEEFIEMIKKHPCLYDYKTSVNTTKKEKERLWNEIATAMEITSEVARNKWKNLKDNYTKHLKGTMASSGPYLKYLHWTWASHMEFMKQYLNLGGGNHQQQNHEEDHETENFDSAQSSLQSEDIPVVYNRGLRHLVSRRRDFLQSTDHTQYKINEEDDDYDATDLIFLGYAKAIKSFSIRRQAQIKLKIAKIITDEEIAQDEESTLYPECPVYHSLSPSPQNDPLNPKVQIKTE